MIECVEYEDGENSKLCVIMLHGLGADGYDLMPVIYAMNLPTKMRIRYVFPHAPVRSVAINFGARMRSWFEILDYDIAGADLEDLDGLNESTQVVHELIERETRGGFSPDSIVLGGFSQGGAMSLYSGLRYPRALAGIVALCAYLPFSEATRSEASAASRQTPLLIRNGENDPVIEPVASAATYRILHELGYDVDQKSYPVDHTVSEDMCRDFARWLENKYQAVA